MATQDMRSSSRCCLVFEIDKCVGRRPFCTFCGIYGAYFGAHIHLVMEKLRNACRRLFSCRGCLGCCAEPQLIIAVDKPLNGLKIQGREVKKGSIAEEFWSSSTNEMDDSAIQSQRSISSISTINQNSDPHSSTSTSTSNPSEFVNHGLLLWNQVRQQWVGEKKTRDQAKVQEPRLSWNATYESLLGMNKPFPQPIPLPVSIWKWLISSLMYGSKKDCMIDHMMKS